MIEARYTLTLDDFREANGLPAAEPARMRWGRWKLLGWVLVVGGFMLFFLLHAVRISRQGGRQVSGAEPFPLYRLLGTMAPALGLCALFVFIMFRTVKQPQSKPWLIPPPEAQKNRPAPNTFGRSVMGWVLFGSFAVIIFLLMQARSIAGRAGASPPTRLPLLFDFVLPLVPIFFLLIAIGVFAGLSSKRQIPVMWESMRHEQQPRTLRADAEAIIVEQATAMLRYAWPHFAGYKETTNLLLVYLSPYSFHMVPKRGFASPADLDAFKGLLMNGVPEGTFLPATEQAAFPVVPMAKVAAVSAESR